MIEDARTANESSTTSAGSSGVTSSHDMLMADRKQPRLEEAARTIMRAFNFCLNDRATLDVSRKWGTYYVLCLLFKCYIKVHLAAHLFCMEMHIMENSWAL
jgi:hypothetical protein